MKKDKNCSEEVKHYLLDECDDEELAYWQRLINQELQERMIENELLKVEKPDANDST